MGDDEKTDFRPVAPGWTVHVDFKDQSSGIDERSDLVGWTWKDGAWCPTYWESELDGMDVVDPRDDDYEAVHVLRRES